MIPSASRLTLIDSLRALATLAVFGFHIRPCVDGLALETVRYSWLGVQVFFAVSGFVIGLSVSGARITPEYVGRFILRRSVRLDPPYWCVIVLAVSLLLASNALLPDRSLPVPGPAAIGAHLVYLQNVLGYGDIVDVFWSLCIEFQLYLTFIVLLGFVQSLSADRCSLEGRAGLAAIVLFSCIGVASILATPIFKIPPKTCFLTYWNEFFVGVLTAWALGKRLSPMWYATYLLSAVVASAFLYRNIELPTAAATAIIILVSGERGWLATGLNWRPLQILGRMSYSFYLVHTIVLSRLTRLVDRSGMESDAKPYVIIPVGFIGSLVAAGLLYWFAELPCVRLSKRFKGQS
ncbi:MAG TPA: acyltransferase [Planctomycetaceae bacterium]|jgi:hypothetical protein